MSNFRSILFIGLFLGTLFSANAQKMTNKKLEKVLESISDTIKGNPGFWEFTVAGIPMLCITDENHNRMRIISPIKQMTDVSGKELDQVLAANFHSALDVKYAVSDEIMWVAYIHPLKELSNEQLEGAVIQVYNAYVTYGTSYSSTDMVFPKSEKEREKERKQREREEIKTRKL